MKKKKKKKVNGLSCDVATYHLRIWSEMDIAQTSVHTNCDGPYIWIWPNYKSSKPYHSLAFIKKPRASRI